MYFCQEKYFSLALFYSFALPIVNLFVYSAVHVLYAITCLPEAALLLWGKKLIWDFTLILRAIFLGSELMMPFAALVILLEHYNSGFFILP